jgi:putative ABC transport system permease protein
VSHLARDLRLALRALVRRPGYAIVAILSLSLGIGANTTIFSLVNAVEFRGLPYRNVDQLVDLHETSVTELCAGCGVGTSYPGFLEWRAGLRAVSGLAGYAEQPVLLAGAESAERVTGAVVSADLFPLLGVAPASGRAIVAADDRAGGEPVVVLSDDLWRRSFGRDTALLGTTVRINGVAHTVVGIMPPRFHFPEFAQLWLPLGPAIDRFPPGNRDLGVIARLKDGATVEQADAELRAIAARQAAEHPATNARWSAEASLYRRALANETGSFFRVLLGAVGFVLLIACANIANCSLKAC